MKVPLITITFSPRFYLLNFRVWQHLSNRASTPNSHTAHFKALVISHLESGDFLPPDPSLKPLPPPPGSLPWIPGQSKTPLSQAPSTVPPALPLHCSESPPQDWAPWGQGQFIYESPETGPGLAQ